MAVVMMVVVVMKKLTTMMTMTTMMMMMIDILIHVKMGTLIAWPSQRTQVCIRSAFCVEAIQHCEVLDRQPGKLKTKRRLQLCVMRASFKTAAVKNRQATASLHGASST